MHKGVTGKLEFCQHCGERMPRWTQRQVYCSPDCAYVHKKEEHAERNREARRKHKEVVDKYRTSLKADGCEICGYNRCVRALEFHHTGTKGATVSKLSNIEAIKAEIKEHPVVILCANCHREVHFGVAE